MGWRYGAGGMLAAQLLGTQALGALVLGIVGWPGTAAAQFTLPSSNPPSSQLAPSAGSSLPSGAPTIVPPATVPPAIVPPSMAPSAMVPPSPGGGVRPPPGMPGPASAATQVSLSLSARFGRDTQAITTGLVWRVFPAQPDTLGMFRIVKEDRSPNPVIALPPGDYVVHVSFGTASAARAVHLKEAAREVFDLPAGGIKLEGRVGDVPIRGNQVTFDIYRGSQFEPGDRAPLAQGVTSGNVVIVPEGGYYIVSNYGDTNAVVRSDIRVQTGKLTDVTVNHHAAVIMLKLVNEKGGEARANTSWSVLTLGGDVIKESTGAFPRVILAEGDYRAIARSDGKTFERNFKVTSGVDGEIEVIAR
jgi:hypothetical protein